MRRAKSASQIQAYRVRYFDFIASVSGTRAISLAAGEVLKKFPHGLPARSRSSVLTLVKDVAGALAKVTQVEHPAEIAGRSRDDEGISIRHRGPLADVALQLLMARALSGRDLDKFDFAYHLRAQELVMLLAHFDAFMGDSLRAICMREPSALK